MEDALELGPRVRALRQERGWTIDQLADAAGVSKGYLSGVENSRTQPSGPILLRLAKALGASVDYLLTGEGAAETVVHERPMALPAELIRLAQRKHWSASHMVELLRAEQSIVARGGAQPRRPFTEHEWEQFAERLGPYLAPTDIKE
jgi:transcriptional regulator with XRE-family HTH domain